jgi:hypothetical protein
MLDVYKEAVTLSKNTPIKTESAPKKTIFDLNDDKSSSGIGLENSVVQLKQAIAKVKEERGVKSLDSKLSESLENLASKESKRTKADIYNEVVVDEVNEQLLKSV